GEIISDCPADTVTCLSPIHMSASPSYTVSTSSTGCACVGAPLPGATHCSKMQRLAAPFSAENSMRVSTPGRQCSTGLSLGSQIFMAKLLATSFACEVKADRPPLC